MTVANDSLISGSVLALATYNANWTVNTGAFNVYTSGAQPWASVAVSGAYWNAASFANDQYAEATCSGIDDGGSVGVSARGASGFNFYYLAGNGSNTYLSSFVSGTGTTLASGFATYAVGDVIRIEVLGTTVNALKNGRIVASVTDSALTSGAPGLSGYEQTNFAVQNWEGGDLVKPYFDPLESASDAGLATYNTAWTVINGSYRVAASNAGAYPNSSSTFSAAKYYGTYSDDQFSEVELGAISSDSNFVGLAVRCGTGTNCYFFYFNSSGLWYFGSVRTGANFDIFATATDTFVAGDVIRLEVAGNVLTVKVNGVTLDARTDSNNFHTAGSPGISGYGSVANLRLINWQGGDLGSGPTADTISEDVDVGDSYAPDVRADATRSEGVSVGDSMVGDVFASATRSEAIVVDAAFALDVRADAARTEAVAVGDSYAVVARAAVGQTEAVEVGDSYVSSVAGEEVVESVALGDSYAVVVRAAATRSEAVGLGDSYAAVGGTVPATQSAGPMLRPPKPLPEVAAALLFVQRGQEFAMTLEVSSAFELSFLAETIPAMALGVETASEFAIDLAQPESFDFEFRVAAPPLRTAQPIAVPRFEAMRAHINMMQDGHAEIEMGLEVCNSE